MMLRPLAVLLCLAGTAFSQAIPPEIIAKYPGLRVQVKVGTKREQDKQVSYRKYMDITPSLVIEGAVTKPMPATTATMLIITMDTEQKYRHRKEAYVVWAAETLSIPAAENGAKRNIEFKPSQVNFDAWRDTTNVGGMIYKYYVFGLHDADTKTLLYFETNHAQLNSLIKRQPEKRAEYLRFALKADFPTDIR